MSGTITLPTWLALVVAALAVLACINHFFLPALRWFVRRTVNRAIADVNTRFRLELPTFQLTKRQVLVDRLVYDPKVLETVALVADERKVMRDSVMAEVSVFAREMVPSFNAYVYFRLGYRIARRFLRSLYRVRVGWVHKASGSQLPSSTSVVFFINHRSNMDYLLVTYLASRRAALSYGAGEWARLWPFRSMLRLAGAYILRRNTADPVYRVVLQRYVQMATAAGVPHAIFSEGQLSRNGMVNAPKLGMLGYVCRTFDPAGDYDIALIPVATNFDRVVEERTLIANPDTDFRGRGARFVLGSTGFFLLGHLWRRLIGRAEDFGMACANFGEPVFLREWAQSRDISFANLDRDAFFRVIEELGAELHHRIIETVPLLPVPVLATVLLDGNATTKARLLADARAELQQLMSLGAHSGIKEGEEARALETGLELLEQQGLIQIDAQQLVAPVEAERGLLQYHANSIIQLRNEVTPA